MAHLICSAISSLDRYIEDMDGQFDWAVPEEEVYRLIHNLEGAAITYLYGCRMYETNPHLAAASCVRAVF
jgi:hypothetical protein